MFVKNAKTVTNVKIPEIFKGKIIVGTMSDLDETEIKLFKIALQLVSEQILFDSIDSKYDLDSMPSVNIIFSLDGRFLIIPENNAQLAFHVKFIIYRIDALRHFADDRAFILFMFIEELTHHFWNIENEVIVKYKVIEIINRYDKNINMETVKGWEVYGV